MSYVLGLTGPTGSGKGIFSLCARDLGFNVIDCDLVAREAVKKGMPALSALTKVFGKDILLENGELNRKAMADVAFSSREKTELLNKTVLPFISKMVTERINGNFVLLDAPTLFESGIDRICNKTVAVLAPADLRKKRIIERDGLDISAANARISAGKPDEFYRENADKIFINGNDIDSFTKTVKIYLEDIIGGNFQ